MQQTLHSKSSRYIRSSLIIIGIFILGFFVGNAYSKSTISVKNGRIEVSNRDQVSAVKKADFSLFWNSWDTLLSRYYDPSSLDPEKLVEGAINGMLKSTGDPYTVFYNATEVQAFNDQMAGKYEGIGVELGFKNGAIVAVSPFEGSPASRAGILPGDYILEVDGQRTEGLSISEVVTKIRGEKDTVVKITLLHDGETGPVILDIVRAEINYKTVSYTMRGDIAHIRLQQFLDNTNSEWDSVVDEVIAHNPKGIILDLRSNPGGYVNSAVYVAGDFLKNKVITKERFNDGSEQVLRANGAGRLANYPLYIVINEGTASASEILAGALKHYEVGKLIGSKTFGKGIVQEEVKLQDGTQMHVTIAEWLLPDGKSIHKEGLVPDMSVELTSDDYKNGNDPQLDRALQEF